MFSHFIESFGDWFMQIKTQPVMFVVYFMFGGAVLVGFGLLALTVYRAYINPSDLSFVLSWLGGICVATFVSFLGKLTIDSLRKI